MEKSIHKDLSDKKNIKTNSSRETQRAGAAFVKKFSPSASRAQVVALKGELGAGKTTFAQGVAKGLGIKEKVLSPTFLIIKKYEIPSFAKASEGKQDSRFSALYHIDCYRIKDEQDLLALGWDKIVSDPKNLVLIEWPERIKKILPKDTISISFKTIKISNAPARRITFF